MPANHKVPLRGNPNGPTLDKVAFDVQNLQTRLEAIDGEPDYSMGADKNRYPLVPPPHNRVKSLEKLVKEMAAKHDETVRVLVSRINQLEAKTGTVPEIEIKSDDEEPVWR